MALREEDNPPELLVPLDDPTMAGRRWCVAQTKSRREKKLAWSLAKAGVPYFLPMVSSDGNGTLRPLFNGCVFMSYIPNDGSIDLARDSTHTFGFLYTGQQARLRQELGMLSCENAKNRTVRFESSKLRVGEVVRVVSGPMKDLIGRVGNTPDSSTPRLFVDMLLLGQKVSVEINPKILEAA